MRAPVNLAGALLYLHGLVMRTAFLMAVMRTKLCARPCGLVGIDSSELCFLRSKTFITDRMDQ